MEKRKEYLEEEAEETEFFFKCRLCGVGISEEECERTDGYCYECH